MIRDGINGEERMTRVEMITMLGLVEACMENGQGFEGDSQGFGKVVAEVVRWNLKGLN